jgi:hypothetical protein
MGGQGAQTFVVDDYAVRAFAFNISEVMLGRHQADCK